MTIVPDTKDWTWVLDRPCPQCGLDTSAIEPAMVATKIPAMVVDNAAAWLDVLGRADVATRPSSATWSPLEYACHVRDVFALFRTRLALMLEEVDPVFANWDQDATAVASRYNEQDPAQVADELRAAAAEIADAFAALEESQYARTGRRSDGATFTVASFGRYFIHDPVHHLHDVS